MRDRLQTESSNLMLMGHPQYLSRLVATRLGVRKDHAVLELRMGGVVRLDRNEISEWLLRWVIAPELLPALTARARAAA